MNLRDIQRATWTNKLAKGFTNGMTVPGEVAYIHAEVSEAFEAWRHGRFDEVGGELADVVLFVAGLAEFLGVDLDAEVRAKIAINAGRVYVKNEHGRLEKVAR